MELLLQIARTGGLLLLVLLIFNLIILVHELGHFLAARWRGLVVERFAIWFGRPLWSMRRNGVEYRLGWIPAGGYVALPQLASMESVEGKSHSDSEALPPASPLDKIIVAFAGPLFSLLLALAFAFVVWTVGKATPQAQSTTTIGYVEPGGPADRAGLRPGDRILTVDGDTVTQWGGMVDSVVWSIVSSEGETIEFTVERGGETLTLAAVPEVEPRRGLGRSNLRRVNMEGVSTPLVAEVAEGSIYEKAGLQKSDLITHLNGKRLFTERDLMYGLVGNPEGVARLTVSRDGTLFEAEIPFEPLPVAEVVADGPAAKAGLKAGDIIVGVNGGAPISAPEFVRLVEASPGTPIALLVTRNGNPVELSITPRETRDGKVRIGIAFGGSDDLKLVAGGPTELVYQGPFEQVVLSLRAMGNTLSALFSPKSAIKAEHLSGPVGIISSYLLMLMGPDGWRYVLWFSVFLNVNLAVLNLLPFPVLDGGHILLSLIEWVRRRPLNVRVVEVMQTGFAMLLIGLMLFLTFNDVLDVPRWFGFGRGDAQQMEFPEDDASAG